MPLIMKQAENNTAVKALRHRKVSQAFDRFSRATRRTFSTISERPSFQRVKSQIADEVLENKFLLYFLGGSFWIVNYMSYSTIVCHLFGVLTSAVLLCFLKYYVVLI
eukprot:UN29919